MPAAVEAAKAEQPLYPIQRKPAPKEDEKLFERFYELYEKHSALIQNVKTIGAELEAYVRVMEAAKQAGSDVAQEAERKTAWYDNQTEHAKKLKQELLVVDGQIEELIRQLVTKYPPRESPPPEVSEYERFYELLLYAKVQEQEVKTLTERKKALKSELKTLAFVDAPIEHGLGSDDSDTIDRKQKMMTEVEAQIQAAEAKSVEVFNRVLDLYGYLQLMRSAQSRSTPGATQGVSTVCMRTLYAFAQPGGLWFFWGGVCNN